MLIRDDQVKLFDGSFPRLWRFNRHPSIIFSFVVLFLILNPFIAHAQIRFASPQQYNLPQPGGAQCMVAADFNGDGYADIAVCVGSGGAAGVGVFMNKGDGTFLPPVIYGTGSGVTVGLVAIDLNVDGHSDLVAITGAGQLNVLLARSNGTFVPSVLYPLPGGGDAWSLVAGDFNGDGKKDIAVSYSGGNAIFLNRNDGTLAFSSKFSAPADSISLCCGIAVLADAADVNGDGVDDILTTEENNGFSILFGQRNGTMSAPTVYTPGFSYAVYHLADVTGDGKPDVVLSEQYAAFALFKNDGTGKFGAPTAFEVNNYGYGLSVAIGDFNGDFSNDVVAGPADGNLYIFTNDGNGNFSTPDLEPVSFDVCCGGNRANAIADFNGDGSLDLAYYDGASQVTVLPNTSKVVVTHSSFNLSTDHGGNTGTVTLTLYGNGPVSGDTFKLSCAQGEINGSNQTNSEKSLTATFDLTGQPPGQCSVIVTQPDGKTQTVPHPFTIEQGGAADIWVDVVGFDKIRAGKAQSYFVNFGNQGNVDSNSGTGIWLRFPSFLNYLTPENAKPSRSLQSDTDTLLYYELSNPLSAGSSQVFAIQFILPDDPQYAHRVFQIQSWTDGN